MNCQISKNIKILIYTIISFLLVIIGFIIQFTILKKYKIVGAVVSLFGVFGILTTLGYAVYTIKNKMDKKDYNKSRIAYDNKNFGTYEDVMNNEEENENDELPYNYHKNVVNV